MKINPMVQLEELLALGGAIQIEGHPGSYEVTVYDPWPRADGLKNHSHHGGETLAEAINRAVKANPKPPDSGVEDDHE